MSVDVLSSGAQRDSAVSCVPEQQVAAAAQQPAHLVSLVAVVNVERPLLAFVRRTAQSARAALGFQHRFVVLGGDAVHALQLAAPSSCTFGLVRGLGSVLKRECDFLFTVRGITCVPSALRGVIKLTSVCSLGRICTYLGFVLPLHLTALFRIGVGHQSIRPSFQRTSKGAA